METRFEERARSVGAAICVWSGRQIPIKWRERWPTLCRSDQNRAATYVFCGDLGSHCVGFGEKNYISVNCVMQDIWNIPFFQSIVLGKYVQLSLGPALRNKSCVELGRWFYTSRSGYLLTRFAVAQDYWELLRPFLVIVLPVLMRFSTFCRSGRNSHWLWLYCCHDLAPEECIGE